MNSISKLLAQHDPTLQFDPQTRKYHGTNGEDDTRVTVEQQVYGDNFANERYEYCRENNIPTEREDRDEADDMALALYMEEVRRVGFWVDLAHQGEKGIQVECRCTRCQNWYPEEVLEDIGPKIAVSATYVCTDCLNKRKKRKI